MQRAIPPDPSERTLAPQNGASQREAVGDLHLAADNFTGASEAFGAALAEVYKYTDNRGELHFVDAIAKEPKKYRKQLENPKPLREISVMDAAPAATEAAVKEVCKNLIARKANLTEK